MRNPTSISLFPIEFNGKNGFFWIACSSKTNPVVKDYFCIFRWGSIKYIDMQKIRKFHRGVFYFTLTLIVLDHDGLGIRFYDGTDLKLLILICWGRSFASVAWPTGVNWCLVFFLFAQDFQCYWRAEWPLIGKWPLTRLVIRSRCISKCT